MKKVLVVSASPRKDGNSETLAKRFADGASASGNEVKVIAVRDMNLKFCTGCLYCQSHDKCVLNDGMNVLYSEFEKTTFMQRLKTMLKVDFKRMFTMPLVYIMAGVSLAIPILILVMTTMMSGTSGFDPTTGVETTMEGFTNVWQAIGSVSGESSQMSMDITGMCNINLIYFLIAIFVCIFVSEDFRSGYAKNLFTVRAKRIDYCISKTAVGIAGGVIMIVLYFVGAMFGGAIAGLPFDMVGFGAGGIAACIFSKICLVAIFVSLAVLLSVVGKQKLWISILGSIGSGTLLFTMLPMISPLNSTIINVIMCLMGGGLFAVWLGAVSNVVLNKTSLV